MSLIHFFLLSIIFCSLIVEFTSLKTREKDINIDLEKTILLHKNGLKGYREGWASSRTLPQNETILPNIDVEAPEQDQIGSTIGINYLVHGTLNATEASLVISSDVIRILGDSASSFINGILKVLALIVKGLATSITSLANTIGNFFQKSNIAKFFRLGRLSDGLLGVADVLHAVGDICVWGGEVVESMALSFFEAIQDSFRGLRFIPQLIRNTIELITYRTQIYWPKIIRQSLLFSHEIEHFFISLFYQMAQEIDTQETLLLHHSDDPLLKPNHHIESKYSSSHSSYWHPPSHYYHYSSYAEFIQELQEQCYFILFQLIVLLDYCFTCFHVFLSGCYFVFFLPLYRSIEGPSLALPLLVFFVLFYWVLYQTIPKATFQVMHRLYLSYFVIVWIVLVVLQDNQHLQLITRTQIQISHDLLSHPQLLLPIAKTFHLFKPTNPPFSDNQSIYNSSFSPLNPLNHHLRVDSDDQSHTNDSQKPLDNEIESFDLDVDWFNHMYAALWTIVDEEGNESGYSMYLSQMYKQMLQETLQSLPSTQATIFQLNHFDLGTNPPLFKAIHVTKSRNQTCIEQELSLRQQPASSTISIVEELGHSFEFFDILEDSLMFNSSNIFNAFWQGWKTQYPQVFEPMQPSKSYPFRSVHSTLSSLQSFSMKCDRLSVVVDGYIASQGLDILISLRSQSSKSVLPQLTAVRIEEINLSGLLQFDMQLTPKYPFIADTKVSY